MVREQWSERHTILNLLIRLGGIGVEEREKRQAKQALIININLTWGTMALLTLTLPLIVGGSARAQGPRPYVATRVTSGPITRPQDPVVVAGADLPTFLNQPISELRGYAYNGANWAPIPFQVDELQQGNFVASGDDDDGGQALLDANDGLVFMENDSGQAASCTASSNPMGGPTTVRSSPSAMA